MLCDTAAAHFVVVLVAVVLESSNVAPGKAPPSVATFGEPSTISRSFRHRLTVVKLGRRMGMIWAIYHGTEDCGVS